MLLRFRRILLALLFCVAFGQSIAQPSPTLITILGNCNAQPGFSLIVPASYSAYATPLELFWFVPGGCPTPTLTQVPGPGTYTIALTGTCLTAYNVFIYENGFATLIGGDQSDAAPTTDPVPAFGAPGPGVQPTCNGLCNGSRNGAWSGAGPLTVTLFPASSSPTIFNNVPTGSVQNYTGLCAGTHSFHVTDINNCTYTVGPSLSFTLGQPQPIAPNVTTQSISCNAQSTGGFSVAPTGGTGNFTVTFSTGASFNTAPGGTVGISGLAAGNYSALIRDANNCTTTANANITQPSSIIITPTQTNITCGGVCMGAASVAVSGGGGSYSYSWSGSTVTTAGATSLCAGTQTLTITDNLNCVRIQTFNITQPASITITPTITNVTCNANCTGAISVTASGPAGPITFTWLAPPSGSIASTTSVISGRCAGTYTLRASANPTCVNTFTYAITQPPAITLTALTTSVNCIGLCNGSATANISGGNGAPYTFTWTAATPPPGPQNGTVATNLCSDNYTLTARDAAGCPASINFGITEPAPFSFGITTTSITCNGACTGIINASPSGGSAPYNYTLVSSGSTVTSGSPVFSNLCAGTYTLRVSDSSPACAQQTVIVISQPNALAGSVNVTSITCAGLCNGNLSGVANGGTPGYTLSWSTPSGTVAGGVLSNRCAGTYTFHVRDANGCVAPATTVALTAPSAHTISINTTSVTCFGSCNGVLSANVSGGTPGYTLNWSTGFTGNPLTNRCAGNYTLTVTDANGCASAATASVASPSSISVVQSLTATACAGSCDGAASFTASGGLPPYTYQVGATTNGTGIFTGLCAGNYIVTVRDANNCSRPVNFSITSPAAISAAITGTRNSCTSCTGGATVTPSNGTPPYTSVVWTNSVGATVGNTTAVNGLCAGNYTVTVSDSRSCTATASVNISMIVIVTAVNGGTGIQCFGACTASAVASATGGLAPYTFSWSPSSQITPTATGLCVGQHTVFVFDSNVPACSNTATINVTQPSDITINTPTINNVSCFNTCNGSIAVSATGGTGTKTFSWLPGGMTTSSVSGLCPGNYTVIVRDANSCSKTMTFNLAAPNPSVTPNISSTNPTNCNNPNTGTICANPTGGNGTYSYSWMPGAGTGSCLTSVPAGSYSLYITSGACTQTFVSTLTNPAGPLLTQLSLQNVSCFGGNNGAATYSASGVGPFSFTWNPAVSQNSSATTSSATGLSTGTYVVASTDAGNNCITTQSFFISQPSSVTVNASVRNIQCSGAGLCDGGVTVTPSGGVAPYSFTWSPGTSNSATVTNLCAGTHTLDLRDNNSCPYTFTYNVITPSSITISSTVTNVQCNGMCNGAVTASASGGTGPITYSWLPQAGFSGSTTATVNNLCQGTYTLHAVDGNSCVTVHTVQITEPAPLTSTLAVNTISCSSFCDGSATLTAGGGTGPYAYSWSSSTVSASSIQSLCAGNYTGTVIDGRGCTSRQSFTIASPQVFSLSLVPSHPLCNSACNGSIQTTASGAQGTVAYVWSPAGTGQNPTGLCAASYTVDATDANGCQAQAVVTLVDPPALLANVSTTNSTCSGVCTGIAVSTPVNAQGAVSYTWLPAGPNTATNTNLCAGTYSLAIEDGNGCAFSQTFAITEPALLNINVSSGPATCGTNNGSITAAPVGGTPNYTFTWISPVPPPIVTTGSVATNLAAGIYTVSLVDANGCTNTVTIPLSNSNGPSAPLSSTNVVCQGDCTGAASLGVISGGTPPYATPVWIQPTPTVQAQAIFSLCAGSYSVQLTDANNCITYTGTTITEPPPLSVIPTVSLPLCRGICDGTVTLSASGGVAPLTYSWLPGNATGSVLTNACAADYTVLVGYNGGACVTQHTVSVAPQTSIAIAPPLTDPNRCFGDCAGASTINVLSTSGGTASLTWNNGQTGTTATGLCNGTYTVTVTDVQGCTDDFTVGITSPPQMTVNATTTQPDCGLCNGSSTVLAAGGAGSTYSFNWTNGGSGSSVSGLCAGLYQVQVTDSLNCKHTENIVVNSSSGITGENVIKNDESCPGLCDGSATITAVGGTAPVTYNWVNTPVPNTGNSAANLCADAYYLQMTDARGCGRTASVQIDAASSLTLNVRTKSPACGVSDGTAGITPTGGTGPYTFSWMPGGATTSTLGNLAPGSYTVIVTGQNGAGCSTRYVIPLSNPAGPSATASQTNPGCFGNCDGAISLTSTLSPAPSYTWSTGASGPSVSGLCEGVVTVTMSANGCETTRNFTISGPTQLNVNMNVIPSRCFGECSGQVAVLATGGSLPYSFAWTPALTGNLNMLDSLCAGNYSAQVTDAAGCAGTATVTLATAPQIVITPTLQNSTCSSVSDGTIAVAVTGGAPSYTLQWEGPGGYTSTQNTLENILAGTYSLNLTDSLGCSRDTLLSLVPTITVNANAGPDFTVCPGTDVLMDGGATEGAITYSWMVVPSPVIVSTSTVFTLPAVAQTQTVLLTAAANAQCFDQDTAIVHVHQTPFLDAGPSHTMTVYSTVMIGGSPTADAPYTVTWTPSFALDDQFSMNPVASNTTDITYTVSLLYGGGCLVHDTMIVSLYAEIIITSGFSPNDDGRNDRWIIDNIEQFPENTVEIYNRWGELLFQSKGYQTPFDGTFRGKRLPVGTYYYVIILNHPAYPKAYTGPVTIFR